ncbi:ESX-1 secretion-associated protein [Mycolicibacterium sp. P9-64]|uniref:type VII secretion target n=1 Tax=Mycolicibacterium sp. P9-64 TaxID=2024612 RepID=UPI0011EC4CB1|nr:type VII secretion target [Mycolicibacterium sp. P9-64]KAA0075620.1 ESX-1 secretion-associated protein [Mycolicibacterium sp. P9-64]
MGESDAARVDVAALLDVARGYDALADAVDAAVRVHLTRLSFDGAVAGRAYTVRGDALRNAVEQVGDGMRLWARASAEIASALRASADRYVEADARGARRVG